MFTHLSIDHLCRLVQAKKGNGEIGPVNNGGGCICGSASALIGIREGVCSIGNGLQLDFMALEKWLFCTCIE